MLALQPLLLLFIVATALAENSCSPNSLQNRHSVKTIDLLFSLYLKAHGKEYCDDHEYQQRQIDFEMRLESIFDLSERYPDTKFGLNHMTDWSDAEYRKLLFNRSDLLAIENRQSNGQDYVAKGNAPESLDWREKGLVTEIKTQGTTCSDQYAFSAIGNIEGQYAKKYNKLISLSVQQGFDCDETDDCFYGIPLKVYKGLAQQGGAVEEKAYPYVGTKGKCSTDPSKIVVNVTGGEALKIYDEETLKDALYNFGPLSIGMNFEGQFLLSYKGGVADPPDCKARGDVNHFLVLVGYGTEDNKPFWIIKNSWGTNYGENGYLRLIRGKEACGVLDFISTATVA